MDAGEPLGSGRDLADEGAAAREEVDDAVRKARFLVQLHQVVVRQSGGGGRLPEGDIAHQDRRHAQVGGDGGEVERGHRQDEAFQRTVLGVVDVHGPVLGLHRIDLRRVVHVVAEEVDRLAGAVDLGLVDVLALAQHASGVHDGTVLRGEELGHLEDDGGAGGPRGLGPDLMGLHRGLHGHFHFLFTYLVEGREDMLVIVRADDRAGVAGADLLAADDDRDVHDGVPLALEFGIEGDALGRAFEISFHRLVGRYREVQDCVVHISCGY